jgi:hypothetical protein
LDPRAGGALNVSGRLDEPIGSLVTASRLKAGGASGRGKRNRRQSSKLSSQETKQTSGEMEPRAGLGLPEESLHAMTETDTETETEDEAAPIKKQRQASKAGTGRPVRGERRLSSKRFVLIVLCIASIIISPTFFALLLFTNTRYFHSTGLPTYDLILA